ncbi:MAG: DegT/DnrJ/EryC1/StrS family aminotransferase [Syntrophobacterales bacterium]|jgi:dTDP-4-amino-4,6-dideoxygalactose transaminase|nr:DegT/DnrJ/EryC1/StrS family aminotransferase [Syntrophobacterales bacterium]
MNSQISERLRLSKSVVGQAEAEAVSRVILEDGYLGMGREVAAFEQELQDFLGCSDRQVICVNSGTAALHLAVQAVTRPGDEVLVQSLTFVASFQAIAAAGALPVACEVDPETVTLDLADARRRLTPKTRAVMPVHYGSNPGDLDAIYEFANQQDLRVIEDAAHAFGCLHGGRKIGSFGDIVCFSFDGIKNITSGEGGAVVTKDPQVARRIRDARLLGVEKDTEKRYAGQRSWDFEVHHQGYRYHMSNVLAAIGRVQLRRFPGEFGPKRVALAGLYRQLLREAPGVCLLAADLREIVPHIQPVRVLAGRRDALREFLGSQGIETGIHYRPNHLLSFFGGGQVPLPVTEKLYGELLSLPLHPEVTEAEVRWICSRIIDFWRAEEKETLS